MSEPRIRVTTDVRRLLVELAVLFDEFDEQTEQLTDDGLPQWEAANVGAERELTRKKIEGLAYQINNAARVRPRGRW